MSYFNKVQIEKIISYALEAGDIAERSQKSSDLHVTRKADGSSVTSADKEISQFINQKLSAGFPEIPIICEEGELREAEDVFWLIDPIDGTSSYVKGNSQFAINIALVKDKKVVFGLIYAPSFKGGRMVFSDHEDQVILQNKSSQRMSLEPKKCAGNEIRIVASSRVKDNDIESYISQMHPNSNYVVEKVSSAVKFFYILEGDADLYLHYRRSMEWDTASGQVLIELMGGKVKRLFSNESVFDIGQEVVYQKPDFANQPFIASLKKEFLF